MVCMTLETATFQRCIPLTQVRNMEGFVPIILMNGYIMDGIKE